MFQSGYRGDMQGNFNRFLFQDIQAKLEVKINTAPKATEIDVWIESFGGDAHVAYKLFLELRHRCRKLRAVIPDCAKSAATLFVLGTDEIFMAPAAELGPLDAQIEHPDREGLTVSALEVSKALGFLGDFALDYVLKGGNQILNSTELPRVDVLREFSRFSASFLKPVVAKLDSHMVYRAGNQLDVARRYARLMLSGRRLSDDEEKRKGDARGLVNHIVEHYPVHEFVISRQEARDLPLPVKDAESYDRWEAVRILHRGFHDGTFSSAGSDSILEVWNQSDLDNVMRDEEDEVEHGEHKVHTTEGDGDGGNGQQAGGAPDTPAKTGQE
jgi:hypothetical protein